MTIFFLLIALCVWGGLWLHAQRRQFALDRALIAALVKQDDKQALALVEAGADPNTRCKPTPTPSLLDLVKHLYHRSISPVNDSPTALALACGATWNFDDPIRKAQRNRPDAPQLVEAMVRHGAQVGARDEDGWTPLQCAVTDNRSRVADVLLQHGADVNAKDYVGKTPLRCAGWDYPDPETVRLLLDHGANVNAKADDGSTPLSASLFHADPNVVGLLLDHGVDVDSRDGNGSPPLILARDHPNIVRLLLQHGADANARDSLDCTALYLAVQDAESRSEKENFKATIRLLLAHGADPNLLNMERDTAMKSARRSHLTDIVALLKRAGAKE